MQEVTVSVDRDIGLSQITDFQLAFSVEETRHPNHLSHSAQHIPKGKFLTLRNLLNMITHRADSEIVIR